MTSDLAPHVVVGLCIIAGALVFWVTIRMMDPPK